MLLTWLIALSFVMLGGPVLGAALHERRRLQQEAQSAQEPAGTTADLASPDMAGQGDGGVAGDGGAGPSLVASPGNVMPGGTVTVAVSGGPGNPQDWVGLYTVGDSDMNPITWQFLSGTMTPPDVGMSSATLTFTMPSTQGSYEFRFFTNNTYNKIATSNTVTNLLTSCTSLA